MARIVSLVVLVVILLLVAGLFLQVMAGFLLPLFLALLLVVMFGPLCDWFKRRCRGHDRIAALLTTGTILLLVLVPLSLLVVEAAYDAQRVYHAATSKPADAAPEAKTARRQPTVSDMTATVHWASEKLVELGHRLNMDLDAKDIETTVSDKVQQVLAPLALRTTRYLGQIMLSLFVMVLATYYFFADGPAMLRAVLRLSPVEGGRTQELIDQFDGITRAVVVATLLSAFVQGLLAGIGYYFAGVGSVFLLTALTMLFTLVPFVGAAIIWVPVCLWLFAVEGHATAAIVLALYCMGVVSTVDNLVKPLVLHGRSNLHPLLALLSVLGGVEVLGAIGILVGPMVVAFLQTLLEMVHTELNSMARPPSGQPAAAS
jgi:predicted PurR-regulated permease PerM